jgi:hypothetical protein
MRNRRTWWLILLPVAAAASMLLAVRIVNAIDHRNNDFFTFWLAGHMVVQGENPYSPDQWVAGHQTFGVTWIPNQAFVYPLPLALLFAPLGLLSLKNAYIFWVALSILIILASLVLLHSSGKQAHAWKVFIPILVGTIFFRPTILTLFNGQISGWLLLLVSLTVYLWDKGRWGWGSIFLPLLMLKPNIGAPILALLGMWLLFQRRYKAILIIAAGLLVLLGVGLIQNPHWVTDYWSIGNTKMAETFGGSPTVWGLGALLSHNRPAGILSIGGIAGLLVLMGFCLVCLRKRKILEPAGVLALTVATTLLVTPYTWTYDQVLLVLPITILTLALEQRGVRFLFVALIFLGLDALNLVLLFFNTLLQAEILNMLIPVIVYGLCLWGLPRAIPSGSAAGILKLHPEN